MHILNGKVCWFGLHETCTLNSLIRRLNSVEISTAREDLLCKQNGTGENLVDQMGKSREIEEYAKRKSLHASVTNSVSLFFNRNFSFFFILTKKVGYKSWISGNLVTRAAKMYEKKREGRKKCEKAGQKVLDLL